MNKFSDDPHALIDDDNDYERQNEVSMVAAHKLDKLQRQYMSSTATKKFLPAGS